LRRCIERKQLLEIDPDALCELVIEGLASFKRKPEGERGEAKPKEGKKR
jgi:hypothetical protein